MDPLEGKDEGSASSGHASRRALLLVLGVSLAVRLAAWGWVAWHGTQPLFDEVLYVRRAEALRVVLGELLRFTRPTGEQWLDAYAGGIWPPLQSLLLVPGLWLGGGGPGGARLVVVLLSVATTLLAVRVTERLSGPRAGLLAGWAHALHPTFVAYSHLVWAETAFACLLLGALAAALRAGRERWRGPLALSGVLLGLASVTRAASAPYLVLFPAWTFLRRDLPRPRLGALWVGGLALLFVLPWLGVLRAAEGRFVLFSTEGGWNLYLGNNPWISDGTGSSWASAEEKRAMGRARIELVRAEGIDRDEAAGRLAVRYALAHPGATVLHALQRLRTTWMADSFVARHVLHVVYPPVAPALAAAGLLLLVLVHVAYLALAAAGFLARPPLGRRAWLLTLLVLGTAPAVLTIGIPRLAMPALVLLLPAVGHALARLVDGGRAAWVGGGVTAAVLLLGQVTGLPGVARGHLMPSEAYEPLVRGLEKACDVAIVRIDELHLRVRGHEGEVLRLALRDPARWFHAASEAESHPRTFAGPVPARSWTTVLGVLGRRAAGPPALELALGDQHAVVEPVDRAAWRVWRPTGIAGVEVAWMGGGRLPPYE